MKFECNTKPLADALDLGIINGNISNFHKKSTIAQVSVVNNKLHINLEASYVKSEIELSGSCEDYREQSIFVGSLLLKQLISTLDSATTTFEFEEGGLVVRSGKSKFNLPKLVDESEIELDKPADVDGSASSIVVDKSDWKYIKDKQLYAIAMSFIHPVYTKVWVGVSGDVIVGDFDNSLFTHSEKSKLNETCLLSDTVINLINAVPEGTKLYRSGNSYVLKYACDDFIYTAQFDPQYEDDEDVGSYNADIFLTMMDHPVNDVITVSGPSVSKFLSQASLFANSAEDTIEFSVESNLLELKDKNVDCKIEITNKVSSPYSITFKSESLRKVIANYGEEDLQISPLTQEGAVVGILVWDDELTTILAGVE